MYVIILTYLFLKHWFVDFVIQTPYQWKNKGTYGHPGGLLHSGLQVLFTIPLCLFLGSWWLLLVEFLTHYHMDWFKMWYSKKMLYTPKDYKFWVWTGTDQLIHYMVYLIMTLVWVI